MAQDSAQDPVSPGDDDINPGVHILDEGAEGFPFVPVDSKTVKCVQHIRRAVGVVGVIAFQEEDFLPALEIAAARLKRIFTGIFPPPGSSYIFECMVISESALRGIISIFEICAPKFFISSFPVFICTSGKEEMAWRERGGNPERAP